MMKRLFAISLILGALPILAGAQDDDSRRFTYGAEWGYVAIFYSGYHYNFFAPEGFRVDPRGYGFGYYGNAEGYVHFGYDINTKWNISLYAGLSGIKDYHLTVPISLRATRFFGESADEDRWLTFLDLGSGICVKEKPQEIVSGKIGGGYRFSLSRQTKLDFTVTLRSVLTHPDIDYYGVTITPEKTNRNNAYISAISFGMAITF